MILQFTKIKNAGLLYFFFERTETDSDFIRLRSAVHSEKNLKKSDFDNIKVGDPISKVELVDPTARFVGKSYDNTFTKHILSDGFMTIEYTKKDNDYFISNISYDKDSVISYSED